MYYPYLFGREEELEAVMGQAAQLGSPQAIIPLIEPAMKPDAQLPRYVAKLTKTFNELKTCNAEAYLVVNPRHGKFATTSVVTQWTTEMATTLADASVMRPAFKVRGDATVSDVAAFAADYVARPVAIVVENEKAVPAPSLAAAIPGDALVFLWPGVDSMAFVAALGTHRVVRVMDNFPAQSRNADYSGYELLATNHQTYAADGAPGFSDFTVLSPQVSFTGGPAGAAAIHLSYQLATGEFWVQHFVSDETDVKAGTFQSKLLEAIRHLDSEIAKSPGKFTSSNAINDYLSQLASGRVTSQGKNKRLQIQHHLHAIGSHLGT